MSSSVNLIPEEIGQYLEYNPGTGHLIWIKKASTKTKVGSKAGTLHSKGYIHIQFRGKIYKAHRIAWFLHYGEQPADELDHDNGNRDDNRIDNLRPATRSINNQNRVFKDLEFPQGVSRSKNRFMARVTIDGDRVSLGCFDTPEEAGHAVSKWKNDNV